MMRYLPVALLLFPFAILFAQPDSPEPVFELQLVSERHTVYVGQPLRMEVIWRSDLSSRHLRELRCNPSFFNHPDIEVAVGRTTIPAKEQLGIPFGGRRLIARHIKDMGSGNELGTVSFSFYLRFSSPGEFDLGPVRLTCALLERDGGYMAPYASYYNNGLFDQIAPDTPHTDIHAMAQGIKVQVLPLPEEGRSENFSGLFSPCEIVAAVRSPEAGVGQILELDLLVKTPVAADFVELPSLSQQRALRSWFKVNDQPIKHWMEDGVRFTSRIRALSTRVRAIPELQIQTFNPATGRYVNLTTEALPLTIHPVDGLEVFDPRSIPGTETTLDDQPEGIWHNHKPDTMSNLIQTTVGLTVNSFWILIAVGPLLFISGLPLVLEFRKRDNSPGYRKLVVAYRQFKASPERTHARWEAVKALMATSRAHNPGAWTTADTTELMEEYALDPATTQTALKCHQVADRSEFSTTQKPALFPDMGHMGKRLFTALKKTAGVLLFCLLFSQTESRATTWAHADTLFETAIREVPGTNKYNSAFAESALAYEAVARSGDQPGDAWYNAGNAWFFSGEIGRSIACYRQAIAYRPFDSNLRKNLSAARALTIDRVNAEAKISWHAVPLRWTLSFLVVLNLLSWGLLLAYVRYQGKVLTIVTASAFGLCATTGLYAAYTGTWGAAEAVIIVPETFGRKGPDYTYKAAFQQPLHDGLEIRIDETRGDWMRIRIDDDRQCWIPAAHAQKIQP